MLYVSLTKSVRNSDSNPLVLNEFLIKLPDTLFNLGKTEGSIDGGQMIKPALARGLQLVGATTRTFCIAVLSGG